MAQFIETSRSNPIGISPHDNLVRELESACSYTGYPCTRSRVDGYTFCLRHILDDTNSPYRQCVYTYPTNGKRCSNATHKRESGGMCEEHTRLAQLMRQKSVRRHKPPPTPESLLVSLAHYAKIEKKPVFENNFNTSAALAAEHKEEVPVNVDTEESTENPEVTKALDPFVDIDAFRVNTSASRIMDYASESESDQEPWTISNSWQGQSFDSSDSENIDDEKHDDKLRHAGIYTAEEVTQITKDKLIRLQSLYIEQFQRLQHVLKERKRDYLYALKREKETLSSIHNQSRDTPREQRLYEKLKSLNRYHKHNGMEAVLHKKSHDRRALHTEGMTVRPPPTVKCVFTEGGVKCGERTLPMSKHCQKHILTDPHQVLFRACGYTNAGFECNEPILDVFKDTTCVYHRTIPPLIKKPKLEDSRKDTKTKDKLIEGETAVIVRQMDEPFNIDLGPTSAGHNDRSINFDKEAYDEPPSTRHPAVDNKRFKIFRNEVHRENSGIASTSIDEITESHHMKKHTDQSSEKIAVDDIDQSKLSAMFGSNSGYATDTTDTASEKDPLNSTMESVTEL